MSTNQIQALVIDPVHPERSGPRTIDSGLSELQTLVGGWIEAVYGYSASDGEVDELPRVVFYLNEEGKIHGLAHNDLATALWWRYDPNAFGRDVLVGPVVIAGLDYDTGENTAVPADVIAAYTELAARALPSYTHPSVTGTHPR
jgi:hypothetical protein